MYSPETIEQYKAETGAATDRLIEMLTYGRPAWGKTEDAFIEKFIKPTKASEDQFGNFWLEIPKLDGSRSAIIWSCHTDTVHHEDGMQKLDFDQEVGMVALDKTSKSSCLGADDTTGVWLMLEMVAANVPGLYIFHRAEEIGAQGSRWIAAQCEKNKDIIAHIKYAIAFDRKGTKDIITHQCGRRTASDVFALSFAEQMPEGMVPSDRGVFTDTESYSDLIPECTNIAVGYYDQHSSLECQDVDFALEMRKSLIQFDEDKLVKEGLRTPGDDDWGDWSYSASTYGSVKRVYPKFDLDEKPFGQPDAEGWEAELTGHPTKTGSYEEAEDLIRQHPEAIAALLDEMGYDAYEISDYIHKIYRAGL